MLIFLFLFFALRGSPSAAVAGGGAAATLRDPEFRMALLIVVSVPLLLFLRHWLGAYEVDEQNRLVAALAARSGGRSSRSLSFLTTTGFCRRTGSRRAAGRGWTRRA